MASFGGTIISFPKQAAEGSKSG